MELWDIQDKSIVSALYHSGVSDIPKNPHVTHTHTHTHTRERILKAYIPVQSNREALVVFIKSVYSVYKAQLTTLSL